MPSFSPFRTLTPFPKPATKGQVLFFGNNNFGDQINVSTSTLNTYQQSIPFWWLLYKVSFFVDWEFTVDETYSGSFSIEFLVNPTSPNARICTEDLALSGEGDFLSSQPSGAWSKYFAVEPFQCDNLHALFYVLGEEIAQNENGSNLTPSFSWYITSAPALTYENDNQYNIYSEEETVELPDGNIAVLNKYIDFFDADYEGISATSSITNVQFEWYTLE